MSPVNSFFELQYIRSGRVAGLVLCRKVGGATSVNVRIASCREVSNDFTVMCTGMPRILAFEQSIEVIDSRRRYLFWWSKRGTRVVSAIDSTMSRIGARLRFTRLFAACSSGSRHLSVDIAGQICRGLAHDCKDVDCGYSGHRGYTGEREALIGVTSRFVFAGTVGSACDLMDKVLLMASLEKKAEMYCSATAMLAAARFPDRMD
jgi:hypothetical protein